MGAWDLGEDSLGMCGGGAWKWVGRDTEGHLRGRLMWKEAQMWVELGVGGRQALGWGVVCRCALALGRGPACRLADMRVDPRASAVGC